MERVEQKYYNIQKNWAWYWSGSYRFVMLLCVFQHEFLYLSNQETIQSNKYVVRLSCNTDVNRFYQLQSCNSLRKLVVACDNVKELMFVTDSFTGLEVLEINGRMQIYVLRTFRYVLS